MHMQRKLHAYAPVAVTLFLAQEQLQALQAEQQPEPAHAVTAVTSHCELFIMIACDVKNVIFRGTKGSTLLQYLQLRKQA